MRQPRSVTMDNGAQRWHAPPTARPSSKYFTTCLFPTSWYDPPPSKRQEVDILAFMKAMYSVSTIKYFLKNPQLENIPTRSTIAAWSSLLMLLNANPPCLLRDNQNISANAKMLWSAMPICLWRAIPPSVISRITSLYLILSRIPHNYWPQCQQGHCLHPLLVWQWLIQKGSVFMQMCIVYWTHEYIFNVFSLIWYACFLYSSVHFIYHTKAQ